MKKTIFYAALLPLAAGWSACSHTTEKEKISDDAAVAVKLSPVQHAQGRATISVTGIVGTDEEALLSFKTGGVIGHVSVKEGDFVSAGQVLATLNLTEINAQVGQAELGFEKAKRDYERAQHLFHDSVATLEQLQNAKTAMDLAAKVLEGATFNQGFSEIRAAGSGYVLKKFHNEGEVVGPGMPMFLLNNTSKGKWVLKSGLSDKQWAAIASGDKARITLDAYPGDTLDAVVSRRAEGADPYSGTFSTEVEIQGSSAKLASGLFGTALIQPSRASGSSTVPYEALLDANGDKGYVFVTNDNKTVKKVEVKIGSINRNDVTIVSGLENYTSVVCTGSAYLTDGSTITVQR